MSAYICDPEHFGALAAYAVLTDSVIHPWRAGDRILTAQNAAQRLARENIRSVAHRYPDDKDGSRPGPCLLDAEIEEAAAIYAAHFTTNPLRLTPVQVFKLCQGYSYQACEADDWRTTEAALQIEWIQSEAVRSLPGYDDADWSLPEIEALYERSAA